MLHMTLNEYQEKSHETYYDIRMNHGVAYVALGLTNECGELAGKIKKVFRDNHGHFDDHSKEEIMGEIGDVLWYLAQICTVLDIDLNEAATGNITKIISRKNRGVIQGEGDKR